MTATLGNSIGRRAVEKIVALRERWHTKNHPFYLDFFHGKIGIEPMGALMAQHFRHTEIVAPTLGVAYSKGGPGDRDFILRNMAEEAGMLAGPGDGREAHDHFELILRFCRVAGLTDEQVRATEQLPAWRARSYYYMNTVREEPFPVIVAMMSTQEGQQPAINGERTLPAFQKYHGYTIDDPDIEFFAEHYIADADHSSRQLELVAKLITTDALEARALEVAEIAVKTRWACMTDVYRTAVLKEVDPLPEGITV